MRLLIVTNMYPGCNPCYPYAGVFVDEQAAFLREYASVDLLVIKGFKGWYSYIFGFLKAWFKTVFGGYDIIHVHYGLTAAFVFFLPKSLRRKVFLTLHGGDILESQGKSFQIRLTKNVVKLVRTVLVVSEEMYDVVKSVSPIINCVVLPCGVDENFFVPRKWNANENPSFVFPGDPERWVKNYPRFLEITEYFPEANISVLHNVQRSIVPSLMRSSNILLLTSHSEGSPQVIKEALASDMCIVSANVGDVDYLLGKVEGTLVFDSDESSAVVASKISAVFVAAKNKPGLRRKRLDESGCANSLIAKRLYKMYMGVTN